jgi:hypothetical protein
MPATLEVETQLRHLRVGLKLIACLVSPILTLHLYFAVSKVFTAREMLADMGGSSLPVAFKLLTAQPLITQSLPIISLLAYFALLFACLRYRSFVFLHYFAASLAIHLLMIWVFNWAALLPFIDVIRNMQSI